MALHIRKHHAFTVQVMDAVILLTRATAGSSLTVAAVPEIVMEFGVQHMLSVHSLRAH